MRNIADKPVRHIRTISCDKDSSAPVLFITEDSIRIAYRIGKGIDRLWGNQT